MDAIRRTYPEAYRSMMPSSNQTRHFLKQVGIERPPGMSLGDMPLLKIGRPEFVNPVRNFGIKLFCALHYKHVGCIVPADAEIGVRFLSNIQARSLDKEILEEIFKSLGGRPTIERCKTELDNQFHYIFAVTPEQASGYVCKFRESFLLVGIVSNSALPEPFDEKPDYGSFKGSPFKPNLKNVSGGANIETHSHKLDE
jgi:hypothetical protein